MSEIESKQKEVVFLTRYSRMGASSRLRTYQYLPYIREKGWNVTVKPLFNDQYLTELYKGTGVSWPNIISCYINRFFVLFQLQKYDRVLIEKELFPFMPSWAEWWISRLGKGYVVDYDDAVFHNYDLHPSFWVRCLLSGKIGKVMRYSRKVMAGNEYLAEKALLSGAKEVEVIPTVVDGDKYSPAVDKASGGLIKVGWIGSPTTLKYVKGILPVLEKLNQKHPFELVIIGGGATVGFSGKETIVAWTEENEVAEIQKLDIGIMPLSNTPWERGKCGYKLIQYMACGLPVVGSPIGVNEKLVVNGVNGFLASDEMEWEGNLGRLLSDNALRGKMGFEGSKMVQESYTLQQLLPIYLDALELRPK